MKALNKNIITKEDFYGGERTILREIELSENADIKEKLMLLSKKKLSSKKKGKRVRKKFRYVDPKVLIDGKIKRLSNIKPKFKIILERERNNNTKGIVV
jgi:hypothetical protein